MGALSCLGCEVNIGLGVAAPYRRGAVSEAQAARQPCQWSTLDFTLPPSRSPRCSSPPPCHWSSKVTAIRRVSHYCMQRDRDARATPHGRRMQPVASCGAGALVRIKVRSRAARWGFDGTLNHFIIFPFPLWDFTKTNVQPYDDQFINTATDQTVSAGDGIRMLERSWCFMCRMFWSVLLFLNDQYAGADAHTLLLIDISNEPSHSCLMSMCIIPCTDSGVFCITNSQSLAKRPIEIGISLKVVSSFILCCTRIRQTWTT